MKYKLSELKGKIRVGDEVKFSGLSVWKKVTYVSDERFYTQDGDGWSFYLEPNAEFELKTCPITWDNIKAGDFIENGTGKRKVLSVHDFIFVLSTSTSYDRTSVCPYTEYELKELGYTIVQPTEGNPIREVTMKEVHERFGEEVKIKEE